MWLTRGRGTTPVTVRRSATGAPATGFGEQRPPDARCSGSGAGSRGVEGGTAPRQPLPGTREAWPQRVGWLKHVSPRLRCRHSGRERTRPGVVGARSLWRFRSAGSIADPARLGVVPTPGTLRIRDPQAPASPHVGLDQSTDCGPDTAAWHQSMTPDGACSTGPLPSEHERRNRRHHPGRGRARGVDLHGSRQDRGSPSRTGSPS